MYPGWIPCYPISISTHITTLSHLSIFHFSCMKHTYNNNDYAYQNADTFHIGIYNMIRPLAKVRSHSPSEPSISLHNACFYFPFDYSWLHQQLNVSIWVAIWSAAAVITKTWANPWYLTTFFITFAQTSQQHKQ